MALLNSPKVLNAYISTPKQDYSFRIHSFNSLHARRRSRNRLEGFLRSQRELQLTSSRLHLAAHENVLILLSLVLGSHLSVNMMDETYLRKNTSTFFVTSFQFL